MFVIKKYISEFVIDNLLEVDKFSEDFRIIQGSIIYFIREVRLFDFRERFGGGLFFVGRGCGVGFGSWERSYAFCGFGREGDVFFQGRGSVGDGLQDAFMVGGLWGVEFRQRRFFQDYSILDLVFQVVGKGSVEFLELQVLYFLGQFQINVYKDIKRFGNFSISDYLFQMGFEREIKRLLFSFGMLRLGRSYGVSIVERFLRFLFQGGGYSRRFVVIFFFLYWYCWVVIRRILRKY